jgi:DNA-binding NarL/FixJ family response regulator
LNEPIRNRSKRDVIDDGHLPGGEMNPDDLTWREQEVLVLLTGCLTNYETAEKLYLAESTVKDYVGNILSKLNVVRNWLWRKPTMNCLD